MPAPEAGLARSFEDQLAEYSRVLDATQDGLIVLDADWLVTAWNMGAERLYGWTADEVIGRQVSDIADLEMSEAQRAAVRQATVEHGRWRGDIVAHRKDGRRVDVELTTVAMEDGYGEPAGYLGIHRDIGERKRAEDELRAAQQRSDTILESIADAFVAVDREWRYTYVNERALRRMQGRTGKPLTRADILGRSMWEMFPDIRRTEISEHYQEAMREQHVVEFETYFPPTDEWIEAHVYPSEAGLSIYYRNVSARRQAEDAVRESRLRQETILESVTDAFYAMDREWRFTYLNARAVQFASQLAGREFTLEGLLGKTLWETLPVMVGTSIEGIYRRALRDHEPVTFEYAYPGDGPLFEVHAYPSDQGLSIYFRDITEQKQARHEHEQRALQQEAVAALGLQALSHHDLATIMDEAAATVARTLDVGLVSVAEVVADGEALVVRAAYGWESGSVGRVAAAGPGSLVGFTVSARGAVVSEDVAADPRFHMSSLLAAEGPQSALSVLISGRHKPFGALGAFSREARSFSATDVSFLQAVANVISTAVERADAERTVREIRDAERSRVARDLHDEALQALTQALAEATGGNGNGRLVPALQRVGEHLRGAIYDLRLHGEDERPFPDLLRGLAEVHAAMATDFDVELEIRDGVPEGALGRTGTEVLRILGEALTNARRHSGAKHVSLVAEGSGRHLSVDVSDDGIGFDPGDHPSGRSGDGIKGMRERAAAVGAMLSIRSEAGGAGTDVRLELPLARAAGDPAARVRVLLVEDHAAVRQAIASSFEQEPGFVIAGQAGSMEEARGMLEGVDVAVLDLGLPDGFGGDLVKELHAASPHAEALVLSASLDRAEVARAVESGAAGVLDKTAHLHEVAHAVRRLRAGETLLPMDEVIEMLELASRRREEEHDDRQALAQLTPRELEVLQALAEGRDSQQIADRLHITVRTERNHVTNVLGKLGVHSQLQAVVFALRYGVVEIRRQSTPLAVTVN